MSTQLWRRLVAGMLTLGVLYACVVAFTLLRVTRERPLPFGYEDLSPAGAYARQLCPGEALIFYLRVTVASAPSVVMVTENWQSAAGRTIADAAPRWYIQEAAKVAEGRQSVPVPSLPAGDWVYERAAAVSTVDHPALLLIPFTVRGNCPAVVEG